MSALHFNHDEGDCNQDRLRKLRPVYDAITRRFSDVYMPDVNISIDESLILWKGRLIFKQFNPSKRARFGLKSFELCESKSGYTYKFHLYTGDNVAQMNQGHSIAHGIVMHLMECLMNQDYSLTIDNHYTSPKLLVDLYDKRTAAFGTVRTNRLGMPADFQVKPDGTPLAPGETTIFTNDKLLAISWKDKKNVNMLSNIHSGALSNVLKRRAGEKYRKPQVIFDHNSTMGGVDLKDQMVHYYTYFWKTHKWYK